MKEEYYFPSADRLTEIHACVWRCEKPRAILQIAHGMQEHIERYADFAEYLNRQDILVAGNDHLGHGRSVADENSYSFFSDNLGPDDVITDMHSLQEKLQGEYPGVPYFLLGHSMGSVFARLYITRFSEELAGAIIMGSFTAPPIGVEFVKAFCRIKGAVRGQRKTSKFLDTAIFKTYNKKIPDPQTEVDWLTRDEESNRRYIEDPMTQHPFTVNAYYGMLDALAQAEKSSNIRNIRKGLPIFLVAGKEDPVGHKGKDIPRIAKWYRIEDIEDVTVKLYDSDRHEILNELDREQVYVDLKNWIEQYI